MNKIVVVRAEVNRTLTDAEVDFLTQQFREALVSPHNVRLAIENEIAMLASDRNVDMPDEVPLHLGTFKEP